MATQVVEITAEFQKFVADRVASGQYASAAAVFDAAQTALLHYEEDDDLDIEYVTQAIEEGIASGVYEGDVFADIRKKLGLPEEP